MGEGDPNEVGCGSHGHPTYDLGGYTWNFERSGVLPVALHVIGQPEVTHTNATGATSSACDGPTSPPSTRLSARASALVTKYPELQPAAELMAPLSGVSENITRTLGRHDCGKTTSLVIFGIVNEATRRAADIIAFVTGPTGSQLYLSQLQAQRRGWAGSAWLEVPTVYGECTVWQDAGPPIQGITSGTPIGRGKVYLAVRLPTKTVVLQPILMHVARETESRLEAKVVCELTHQETGQCPHADIAFDPWYTSRVALVDQNNQWSVWELPGANGGINKQVCRGSLNDDVAGAEVRQIDDGWARVTWVFDTTLIAVCNRRQLKIIEISDNYSFQSHIVEMGRNNGPRWIFDLAVMNSAAQVLFALTSTHLTLLTLDRRVDSGLVVRRCLSIRHYRNAEDFTLRLRLSQHNGDIMVLISSGTSPVITAYTLHISGDLFVTVKGTVELDSSSYISTQASSGTILGLHLSCVPYNERHHPAADPINTADSTNAKQQFYSIIVLDSAWSLHQCLCATSDVGPPIWRKALPRSATRAAGDDTFVDENDWDATGNFPWRDEPVSNYVSHRRALSSSKGGDGYTLGYTLCIQHLNRLDTQQVTNIAKVLNEARHVLDSENLKGTIYLKTVRELLDGEIIGSDVALVETGLDELQQAGRRNSTDVEPMKEDGEEHNGSPLLTVCHVALPSTFATARPPESRPSSKSYDWVSTSLTDAELTNMPELVRYKRERLAKRVGVELTLAGRVFRAESTELHTPLPSEGVRRTWELPTRSAFPTSFEPLLPMYRDKSHEMQRSALPTPSASISDLRSTATVSSYSHNIATHQVARLARYTTFSSTNVPQSLPRTLDRVTSHWVVGQNPSTYNWRTIGRDISQQEQEYEDEDMTERERQRLQRRAERHIRRQRREAEESQRQRIMRSQTLDIASASQPQGAIVQSESQPAQYRGKGLFAGMSQQTTASQVVPGRHGGRAPPSKKRKHGF